MRFLIFFFSFVFLSSTCWANSINSLDTFKFHFYGGITGGYGATTWNALVPPIDKQNDAINISTPKQVTEGGGLWGVFMGYELLPWFALELAYMHYPDAFVEFDNFSLFCFDHDGLAHFRTRTESLSLMAKVMFLVPRSEIRIFSSFGAAKVYRHDLITDGNRNSPSFGAGFNFNFTPHLMGEIGANYIAGFGESELNPTMDYFPFLYSVFIRVGFRF